MKVSILHRYNVKLTFGNSGAGGDQGGGVRVDLLPRNHLGALRSHYLELGVKVQSRGQQLDSTGLKTRISINNFLFIF